MMRRLLIAMMMLFALLNLSTQAGFFQCSPDCLGTPFADLMIGSDAGNAMQGDSGNDFMSGGGGVDDIHGDEGADVMFGGTDWDALLGGAGNDIFLPGPDAMNAFQNSSGNEGNDTFIVFVGETIHCQSILGGHDFDTLHLIGFGPFVAEFPFGQAEPVAWPSNVVIQDPVTGGYIFVPIGNHQAKLERITGLPSPDVTVLTPVEVGDFRDQNCNIPD
jgi:hypothetical protein